MSWSFDLTFLLGCYLLIACSFLSKLLTNTDDHSIATSFPRKHVYICKRLSRIYLGLNIVHCLNDVKAMHSSYFHFIINQFNKS